MKILDNKELGAFCRGISMMLGAGVMINEAVSLFGEDADDLISEVCSQVTGNIDAGDTFAEAASKTGAFPEYALAMIKAGETAGRLDEVLDRMADVYERRANLMTRLKHTLVHPVSLMLLMCVVLAVLVFAVMPVFEGVYNDITGSVAASAYSYVVLAKWIGRVCLVLSVVVCVLIVCFALFGRTPKGMDKLKRMFCRMKFVKQTFWKLAVANITEAMAVLIASGMDTDTALELAKDTIDNPELEKAIEKCEKQMEHGDSLAYCFYKNRILPPIYGRMLISGASGGTMDAALSKIAGIIGGEAEDELCGVIDSAEPVIMGFLTVSVGVALLSIMLPLIGIMGSF